MCIHTYIQVTISSSVLIFAPAAPLLYFIGAIALGLAFVGQKLALVKM